MTYTIVDVPQRTPEWFASRRGRLTGSVAGNMLATVKTGETAARRNLRVLLMLERLTGKTLNEGNGFVSAAMQQGIDREAAARGRYEALTGELVTETGFIQCVDLMAGTSLDGCVMQNGRIVKIQEFKCPEPSAHLDVLKTGALSANYRAQVTHALWVTGAESCDWMSFNPDFPEWGQTKLITIARDEQAIAEYDAKARAFLAEVDRELLILRDLATAF